MINDNVNDNMLNNQTIVAMYIHICVCIYIYIYMYIHIFEGPIMGVC